MIFLGNKYVVAFVVPLILILCGGIIKKLVRGAPSWKTKDFYLGIEMLFAAFTSAIFNIISISRELPSITRPTGLIFISILHSAVFLVFAFCMLLIVMGIHQWQENTNNTEKVKDFWLGLICNIFGVAVLAVCYLGVMVQ